MVLEEIEVEAWGWGRDGVGGWWDGMGWGLADADTGDYRHTDTETEHGASERKTPSPVDARYGGLGRLLLLPDQPVLSWL